MDHFIRCHKYYINDMLDELERDLHDTLWYYENSNLCTDEFIQIVKKELDYLTKIKIFDKARWNTFPRIDTNNFTVFEVPIVDHCNYNCAYCNHWSNIAPKHFYDYDQMMKDFERLYELYQGECSIKLMGGEPTIHPRLRDIIINGSKYFNQIQILTNGLTLIRDVKKKDYSLLDLFEEYDVKLEITRYPNLDYTELYKVLEEYDFIVDYEAELGNPDALRSNMQIHGVNLNGAPEWKNRHLCCGNSNVTVNMKEGKIYACPFKACLDIFIKYYGLEDKIKVTEEDYIDIYKAQSKEEIALFLTKGTPACKYCTGDTIFHGIENHPWRRTTKSITEWIDSNALAESLQTDRFDILKNS